MSAVVPQTIARRWWQVTTIARRSRGQSEDLRKCLDIPIASSDRSMELWLALLAEVLIGQILFIDQAHAATVLPD